MSMSDGEAGQYENVKGSQYCMKDSWESRNNMEMNKGYGVLDSADQANTPHPATQMKGEKNNRQLGPMAEDNKYNYNADR